MNFKGQTKLLTSNLSVKWLRTLLASGGIIIGVLCLTLTTALTTGIMSTIKSAANSIPEAKEITINPQKEYRELNNFIENNESTMNLDEINKVQSLDSNLTDLSPRIRYGYAVDINLNNSNCTFDKVNELSEKANIAIQNNDLKFINPCPTNEIVTSPFAYYFQKNKQIWEGSKDKPKENEVVLEYNIKTQNYFKKFNINNSSELLGKTIKVQGRFIEGMKDQSNNNNINSLENFGLKPDKQPFKEMKINSIVNYTLDNYAQSNFMENDIDPRIQLWISNEQVFDVYKNSNPKVPFDKVGFSQIAGTGVEIEKIEQTIENLKTNKVQAFSPIVELLKGLNIVFAIVTGFLSAFGILALVVSIFGIINVISMSVLEKQKEIGILKSLGASNSDVFGLFIGEGIVIGLIGWVLGSSIAYGLLVLANFVINNFIIPSSKDIQSALKTINVEQVVIYPPFWLYLSTLGIALFFTIVSSIIPSINAANKRPVDVLRNE
ncbi:MAG: ABC transporter permease [Patescibacteria group bacterium]